MSWSLLALDLDGTLLEPDHAVLPEVVARLNTLSDAGRMIAIASGRPREDIEAIIHAAGLSGDSAWPHLFVANERDIFHRRGDRFEPDEAWNEPLLALERQNLAAIRRHIGAWLSSQPDAADFARYDDEATEDRRAIIALTGKTLERVTSCQRELNRRFAGAGVPVLGIRNRLTVVFRHESICKGRALLEAATRIGIEAGSVLAIGDSENDLGMLDGRYGFLSACPANSDDEIRRVVLANGGTVASQPCGRGVLEIVGG